MAFEVLKTGQLKTNCYLSFNNSQVWIIDPGDDAEYIMSRISDIKLKPEAVLATHGHFDHALAATELKLAYSIPFYLSHYDLSLLKRMSSTARYFTGVKADPPPLVDNYLEEGMKIGELEVIKTPGHTPGSVCLYSEKEKLIFTGDTVFAEGSYGRTDLGGGSDRDMQNSIRKILSLPAEVKILPGHGKSTTVKQERVFYDMFN